MSPEILWTRVRDCFAEDDGWFPTVALVDLQPDEVGKLYLAARDGTRLVDPCASFWDYETDAEIALDDVPNAGLRVANRLSAPFAFAVEGIVSVGIRLPNLGFQVFESVFAVHYNKGAVWTAMEVFGFFAWLKALVAMTGSAKLDLTVDGPPDPQAFLEAWSEFTRTSS